jgi:hypothetical protein
MLYIHTTKYCAALKKGGNSVICMDEQRGIMLNEINQSQNGMIPFR